MKKQGITVVILFLQIAILLLLPGCSGSEKSFVSVKHKLTENWKMQASDKLAGISEDKISTESFNDKDWYQAVVPGTVLGSLVSDGLIKDPYFGINMQSVDPQQFKQPWWFRTTFNLSGNDVKQNVALRFNGINYRADLWVNGIKVAGKDSLAGTFRMFIFNIDKYKKEGINTLALKIWQHADGEYSIGFVDWNPLPRDRTMGIFRDVFLEINKGVTIQSPFVYSKVNKTTHDADLYIQAELQNNSDKAVSGTLRIDYELGTVEKRVKVKAGETLSCKFKPEDFRQLSVKNPELWWPNGMGKPKLYSLKAEFVKGDNVLDKVEKKYGIREITSYLNKNKDRTFEINGKFILLKGGGWTDDVLLQLRCRVTRKCSWPPACRRRS